jgi:hypothetical protein
MMRAWWMFAASTALAMSWAHAARPDLTGTWQVIDPPSAVHTRDGQTPPLLAAARTVYEQNQHSRAAKDWTFDTTSRCLPPGIPRLMYMPMPFEIIQRDNYLFMLFEYQHLNRQILFTDQHDALTLGRRFLGDSIARWDGDTLQIDTTGLKIGTLLDAAGLPHSRDLHVVERYTLRPDGQQMQALIRIEDPKTYAAPWETTVRFKRLHNVQIKEDVCVDRTPNWLRDMQRANQ